MLTMGVAASVLAIQWLAGIGFWSRPADGGPSAGEHLAAAPTSSAEGHAKAATGEGANAPGAADASGDTRSGATGHTGQTASPTPAVPTTTFSLDGVKGPGAGQTPADAAESSASPASVPTRALAQARAAASAGDTPARLRQGMNAIAHHRLVKGRRLLSNLLFNHARGLSPADAQSIRKTLAGVNKVLVFSPTIAPGDPVAEAYRVQSGDTLSRVAASYDVPYQFLARINHVNPRKLQVGQTLKMIHGPFHVRVVKADFRMDVFLRNPEGQAIYVRSFPVGLGKNDATPPGRWIVQPGGKVQNPSWTNPRTHEHYGSDDPRNPVGEYWIALQGADDATKGRTSYGIHGTIVPDSIGQQRSMGCVRLHKKDIEQVFHMLDPGSSTVRIVP